MRDGEQATTKRRLVIGCGFIGERFACELARRGEDTVVLTRSEPGAEKRTALGDAEVIVADAASPLLGSAMRGVGHVIYAAGGLMPAESEQDPALDAALTLDPLRSVLDELAARASVTLTYISSGGTVYGRPRYLPVDEDHPTEPISAYGVNKLACERLVVAQAQRHRIDARILRCSNVYGETQPADRGQGAIATFIDHLRRSEPILLYGDGEVVRDYVHVSDVVNAALALIERPFEATTVLNVGSGVGHSLAEVIGSINEISDRSLEVERLPARAFDVREIVLDVSRLKGLIPFDPMPLEEGIRRVLEGAALPDRTPEAAARPNA
jgi:UDP-glucose 4-epimerase